MNAIIKPFDTEFDGTHMTPDEIMREARDRGWPGIRIDASEFVEEDKLTVRRMPRREAWGDD